MKLDVHHLEKACEAFDAARCRDRSARVALESAIEAYLTEAFKPGQIVCAQESELTAVPQRDYRKELWVEVYLKSSDTRTTRANAAVEAFDKFFGEKP